MKKLQLLFVLMLFSFAAMAQSPTLFFRFANMETVTVGPTDYFQFDVEVKADIAGTYHRDMQIYFTYNPVVFGESIKLNNKVTVEKIGIMAGEVAPGLPKYKWVNEGTTQGYGTDNTPTTYYISSLPQLEMAPLPTYHNLMPTDWAGYMRVTIEITNPGPAGIQFLGAGFIDGGCYYFDPATGAPVVYTFPYNYTNDLMTYMVGAQPEYLLTLNVSPEGSGTFTQSGTGSYTAGTEVALTADPNPCYSFVNWTDGSTVVSTVPDFTYTMPAANTTLTANFQLLTYEIAASAGTGGTITPSGTITLNCGGSQTFSIMPNLCYAVADVLVDGISVGATNSYTFYNVTANHTIEATFVMQTYTITASAGPGGTISPSGTVTVNCGDDQTFTITPSSCYVIADVLVDGSSVGAVSSHTFNDVGNNHTIEASFQLLTYTITASAGTGGSISPSGAVSVNCGADQAFTMTPESGYLIEDVLVDGTTVGAVTSHTFTNVTANHTIAASFMPEPIITLVPFTTTFGVDAGWNLITAAGTYGEKTYTEGGWFFHSNSAVRGTLAGTETFDGSAFSFRIRGDLTISNLGELQNPMTGFSFQLRDWMTSATVNRPIEYSFDGGTTWTTAFVINKAWFAAYQVYQEFVFYFPEGAQDLTTGNMMIRIGGGVVGENFARINVGQFKALNNAPVYYNLSVEALPVAGGTATGSGSYYVGQSVPVSATANPCYEFTNWTVGVDIIKTLPAFTYLMPAQNVTLTANFQMLTYTITATAGTGGTIAPSGAVSVNCGADQSFTITPNSGFGILDVLVDGLTVGAVSTYDFTNVTANHTIEASFYELPPDTYALTLLVNPAGAGTVTGAGSYAEGTIVPITATANACYEFVNWTDGSTVVSTLANFDYTMPAAAKTLTANFQLLTYTITATAGTGGTITPSGAVTVNCGADQTFTIAPATGYMIDDVLVDEVSVGALSSYTFTNVTANHTIAASFAEIPPTMYTLTVNVIGQGDLFVGGSSYSGPVQVEAGTVLSIQAFADFGWMFEGYTGDLVSTNPMETILMNGNKTVTATFIQIPPNMYTLTVNIVGMGDVFVNSVLYTEAITVAEGTSLNLEAVADIGWMFEAWSGDLVSTDPTETILMNGNKTVTANFSEIPPTMYTLTVNIVGMGDVFVNSVLYTEAITVAEGTSLNLEAVADMGWMFEAWSGDLVSIDPTETILMNGNKTVTANFSEIPPTMYTLTVNIVGMGDVFVNSVLYTEAITVAEGTSLNLEAIADMGWMFEAWSGDLASTDPTETILMNGNKTVTATFTEIPPLEFTLTLLVNPMGAGTVTGGGTYEAGTVVPITATANACYTFVNWTQGGNEISDIPDFFYAIPTDPTLTTDITLTANFQMLTYTITASAGPGGSISPSGEVIVNCGADQAFSITPEMGYVIEDVMVDGTSVGAVSAYVFSGVTANHTIHATFAPEAMMYALTLVADPMAGGILDGAGSYAAGTPVMVYAYPATNYVFVNWTWGETIVSTSSSFEFTMPEMDVTLVAHFQVMEFVYCAYSQGYWFAKPQTVWPYDVCLGGTCYNKEEAIDMFWPANTPTKRAFTQYAAIYLSGVTLSEFPELQAAMMVIEDYFANVYPEPAGKLVNRAAGFIGEWIKENECYNTFQGIAEFGNEVFRGDKVDWNGIIASRAYPNPFRDETTIEFMVQENVNVTIEVYNMVGERISVLFDGPAEAFEKYMVTLRIRDLYTGFYFYRLTAGDKNHTGRLIRVK